MLTLNRQSEHELNEENSQTKEFITPGISSIERPPVSDVSQSNWPIASNASSVSASEIVFIYNNVFLYFLYYSQNYFWSSTKRRTQIARSTSSAVQQHSRSSTREVSLSQLTLVLPVVHTLPHRLSRRSSRSTLTCWVQWLEALPTVNSGSVFWLSTAVSMS